MIGNKKKSKKYYSKLLLFGEYTVIFGSKVLAIPFPNFFGQWQYANSAQENQLLKLQQQLPGFLKYLKDLEPEKKSLFEVDYAHFEDALKKGIFFDSNIPVGYGVGSSGALCAAFLDIFCKFNFEKDQLYLNNLKKVFSVLESFFHGSSSGIDPLICFVNQPILMEGKGLLSVTSIPQGNPAGMGAVFLLDTKIPRHTGPFVQIFLKQSEDEDFSERCRKELIPWNERAIEAFRENHWSDLISCFEKIGNFQYQYFNKMIPEKFQHIWRESLMSNTHKLKICGAGGGGFILGITNDWNKTQDQLGQYSLLPILRF